MTPTKEVPCTFVQSIQGRVMAAREDADFLGRVSWLYYVDDLTQQEIAVRLGLSRFRVLRALQQAKQLGFVKIDVSTDHLARVFEIEDRLVSAFELREAIVFRSEGMVSPEETAARFAAEHLCRALTAGSVLAVGISSTVGRMPPYIRGLSALGCTVVSLGGAVAVTRSETPGNPTDLVTAFARVLGGSALRVLAPVTARTSEARAAIMAEPDVTSQLEAAAGADFAVIGIGHLCEDAFLRRQGVISEKEIACLTEQGAVGDLVARYYRLDGTPVTGALDDRVIAVDLEILRKIPHVIGVALGEKKRQAILGALRGRYLDVMVTDESTAAWLCRKAGFGEGTRCAE